MTSEEDKKRWKEEAEELKKDLASRPKTVKKREVQIRVGRGTSSKKRPTSQPHTPPSSGQDDFMRRQLGL